MKSSGSWHNIQINCLNNTPEFVTLYLNRTITIIIKNMIFVSLLCKPRRSALVAFFFVAFCFSSTAIRYATRTYWNNLRRLNAYFSYKHFQTLTYIFNLSNGICWILSKFMVEFMFNWWHVKFFDMEIDSDYFTI